MIKILTNSESNHGRRRKPASYKKRSLRLLAILSIILVVFGGLYRLVNSKTDETSRQSFLENQEQNSQTSLNQNNKWAAPQHKTRLSDMIDYSETSILGELLRLFFTQSSLSRSEKTEAPAAQVSTFEKASSPSSQRSAFPTPSPSPSPSPNFNQPPFSEQAQANATDQTTIVLTNTGREIIELDDETKRINQAIIDLHFSLPIETPAFSIEFDYLRDVAVVIIKSPREENYAEFKSWLKQNGLEEVESEYFEVSYEE